MTVDFGYLRDYLRGEEVESNSVVLEIPQRTMSRKQEEKGFGSTKENRLQQSELRPTRQDGSWERPAALGIVNLRTLDEHLQAGPE